MAADTKTKMTTDGRSGYESAVMIEALRALEASCGYDPGTLTITQFGYMGTSSFSGSTHGKDAADLSYYEYAKKSKNGRRLGLWVAPRTVADGGGTWGVAHCHTGLIYGPANSSAMNGQIAEYFAGGDGLSGSIADRNWRPRYPKVKFLYAAHRARWIAVRATKGYDEAGGHADDVKVSREKGFVWPEKNIATVRVNSVDYLVSSAMTFYKKADFAVYVPGFVTRSAAFVVADAPAYGRIAPDLDSEKITAGRALGYAVNSVGYVPDALGKPLFERTAAGAFYYAKSLKAAPVSVPAPTPTPTPTAPASVNVTLGTQNVIARRMSPTQPTGIGDWKKGETYAKRVGIMAPHLKGASIVATQEAGASTHADLFDAALEKALGGTWSHYRQGDEYLVGDITQTVTYENEWAKIGDGAELEFTPAGPGSSHDSAPALNLKHRVTGIEVCVVSLHLIAGSTAQNKIDRGKQVTNLIPKAQTFAGGRPIIFVGDLNDTIENLDDQIGKAFAAKGYTDVEASPCAALNAVYNEYTGAKNPPVKGSKQLSRAFVKLGEITPRLRVIVTDLDSTGLYKLPFGSDHLAVLFELTIYRK